jgi:hypothetical protein
MRAGAVEKQKMVYVLNRDQAANLTISSPLEAHKSHNIVFSIAGMDMGFDNPMFAAIELDYADADQVSALACNMLQGCFSLPHAKDSEELRGAVIKHSSACAGSYWRGGG